MIVKLLQQMLLLHNSGLAEADLGRALLAWRYQLSRDEIQVLQSLALGLTNDEIAEKLGVAEEATVKNRIKAIFNKMHVKNRVQAAAIAVLFGLGRPFESLEQPKE
jgi:DNA-binding NarL/FixJ family response regulator